MSNQFQDFGSYANSLCGESPFRLRVFQDFDQLNWNKISKVLKKKGASLLLRDDKDESKSILFNLHGANAASLTIVSAYFMMDKLVGPINQGGEDFDVVAGGGIPFMFTIDFPLESKPLASQFRKVLRRLKNKGVEVRALASGSYRGHQENVIPLVLDQIPKGFGVVSVS